MKYFSNINTADELRKAYRRHVIDMHPDRGGNEEEFKQMQAEFEQLKKQMQSGTRFNQYAHTETAEERARRQAEEQREREEWARWEAEEKARREREEREKAERIRKAQEVSRAAVRAWAAILERVQSDETGKKARYYRFEDKKAAAAFVATTKRNVKAVINHYFPGLKVTVNISGEIWKEKFIIKWEDGPSEKQLRDTCKELAFFLPSSYCCAGPYEDYGHYDENDSTAPWREAYGQALGDIDTYQTARTLSDEGKQEAEQMAARYFKNFDPQSEADKFTANLQELIDLANAAGFYGDGMSINNIFRTLTGNYYGDMYGVCSKITGEVSRRQLRKMLAEHMSVTATAKEKTPEFAPTYGPAYKAIKKALGANLFYAESDGKERELSIFEAAERLTKGEAVNIGHKSTWDGETYIYGTDRGGYKTQQKRAAKFEAVGIILEGVSYNTYGTIKAASIRPETLEALRREAQDVEQQRKAWEAKQQAGEKATEKPANGKKTAKTADTPQADQTTATSDETTPAEGLELVSIPGGVAVTGDSRTTYKHRRDIKAHGARWNRDAQQWQATDPADVAALRRWFGLQDEEPTDTTTEADTMSDTTEADEPTTDEPQADTMSDTEADTTDEPTADTLEHGREITALCEAVADVLRIFADIMQQAAQWEGVTVPAATLQRWRQEATEGTKTAAARLCEVCACLASLTPDSRKDFDALGVIFWTLAEQIRNGYDPDTINTATDYARAQLFDLIERTQTANQARAVREANDPNPDPLREAA